MAKSIDQSAPRRTECVVSKQPPVSCQVEGEHAESHKLLIDPRMCIDFRSVFGNTRVFGARRLEKIPPHYTCRQIPCHIACARVMVSVSATAHRTVSSRCVHRHAHSDAKSLSHRVCTCDGVWSATAHRTVCFCVAHTDAVGRDVNFDCSQPVVPWSEPWVHQNQGRSAQAEEACGRGHCRGGRRFRVMLSPESNHAAEHHGAQHNTHVDAYSPPNLHPYGRNLKRLKQNISHVEQC